MTRRPWLRGSGQIPIKTAGACGTKEAIGNVAVVHLYFRADSLVSMAFAVIATATSKSSVLPDSVPFEALPRTVRPKCPRHKPILRMLPQPNPKESARRDD